MQLCHGWWRPVQRRFWTVSCLSVASLSCSCSLHQCVLCFACLLCRGAASRDGTARHGMARLVTALLRLDDAARVWLLATARTNGTTTTNGLRDERIQICHGWWRQNQHRFCRVSCLFVVFLSCSCWLRQCVLCSACILCCGAASRHGMARLVTARLRFVDAARAWVLAATRMNGTVAIIGLRDERMQLRHGWWRRLQRRYCIVSCFVCRVVVFFVWASSRCVGADSRNDPAR